jgi:hypothetical protein
MKVTYNSRCGFVNALPSGKICILLPEDDEGKLLLVPTPESGGGTSPRTTALLYAFKRTTASGIDIPGFAFKTSFKLICLYFESALSFISEIGLEGSEANRLGLRSRCFSRSRRALVRGDSDRSLR